MLGIIFLLSGTPTILREVLAKLLLHAITIRGDIEADDHKKFIEIASDIMQGVSSFQRRTHRCSHHHRALHPPPQYETKVHNAVKCLHFKPNPVI